MDIVFLMSKIEKWNIEFVNTGLNTMTGGRLKRVKKFLKNDKNFCLTYGDGLCDVNIKKLITFHLKKKQNCNSYSSTAKK